MIPLNPIINSVITEHSDKGRHWCAAEIMRRGGRELRPKTVAYYAGQLGLSCPNQYPWTKRLQGLFEQNWPDVAAVIEVFAGEGIVMFPELVHIRAVDMGLTPARVQFTVERKGKKASTRQSYDGPCNKRAAEVCRMPWWPTDGGKGI